MVEQQSRGPKHDLILDAAIGCFQGNGFAKTRISDIASEAGVGKGTVYEYYRSKEQVLLDACLRCFARNEAKMAEILGVDPDELAASGMHPVKAAHQLLHTVLTVLLSTSRQEQRLFAELININDELPEIADLARQEMSGKLDGWRANAFRLYEACHASGHFREIPDAGDAARLIVAAVDGLIWQQMWTGENPEDTALRMANAWCHLHLKEPHRLEEFLA